MIGKDVIGPPGFSERPMRAALTLDFPTVAQERREHESRFGGRPLRVLFCHFAGSALNLVVPLPRGGARREELRRKRNFKHLFRCVPRRGKSLPFGAFQPMWFKNDLAAKLAECFPAANVIVKAFFSPFGAALIAILFLALSQKITTVLIPASMRSLQPAALIATLPPGPIDKAGVSTLTALLSNIS